MLRIKKSKELRRWLISDYEKGFGFKLKDGAPDHILEEHKEYLSEKEKLLNKKDKDAYIQINIY